MAEQAWANLPALIDLHGGYDLWDVEQLVLFAGSTKPGAIIIQGIEQKLAEHNIGHLPTRLPTRGKCPVLLYNKDQPNLGYVLSLVHQLATQEVDDGTNGSAHQLKTLLDGISQRWQPTARRDAIARQASRSDVS